MRDYYRGYVACAVEDGYGGGVGACRMQAQFVLKHIGGGLKIGTDE